MAAKFDNLDDVNSKFAGTVCLHEKKPILVKGAIIHPEVKNAFNLLIVGLNGRSRYIGVDDPGLNYKEFNIGYANAGYHAAWWFRRPGKQYRQGLKRDQMGWRSSNRAMPPDEVFNFNKPFNQMLENIYPSLEACQARLVDKEVGVMAFHKDFALSWDNIHRDFFLEYRGNRIGASIGPNLKTYHLLEEYRHLNEALEEALPNVHG